VGSGVALASAIWGISGRAASWTASALSDK
jgi:hypothetical protein